MHTVHLSALPPSLPQGENEGELPERILFAVRIHHLNVPKAPLYEAWEHRED